MSPENLRHQVAHDLRDKPILSRHVFEVTSGGTPSLVLRDPTGSVLVSFDRLTNREANKLIEREGPR